jgi:outer membrane protein TolC
LYQQSFFSENTDLYGNGQNVGNQYIALNLSLPIFTGGKRVARIQQARIEVDQLAINKMQLSDNLKVQFETAKAEYDYALNSYFTQLRNVEISKKIRDVSAKN